MSKRVCRLGKIIEAVEFIFPWQKEKGYKSIISFIAAGCGYEEEDYTVEAVRELTDLDDVCWHDIVKACQIIEDHIKMEEEAAYEENYVKAAEEA